MNSTKDIYLSALWMAMGAKFERVDRTDPRHQVFYFSESDVPAPDGSRVLVGIDLLDLEKQWVNKEIKVNAWEFKEAIQRMKSIIHSS